METWKDIKGYKGLYQVSNYGRVKSLGNRSNHSGAMILKQSNVSGYMQVTLTKNSIPKIYKVHRLVAIAFIPNPLNKPQVNHIDGNKQNNRADNLEWNTASENIKHAFNHGLIKAKSGADNKRSVKVIQIEANTGAVVNIFFGTREAEKHTGIARANINSCCQNKLKTAGGYKWRKTDE